MANRGGGLSVSAVFSRVIAAIVGGYLLANLGAIVISYGLPGERANAVGTGLLISFLIYACAALWVFSARTAWLAWLGLLVPCLLFVILAWPLMPEATL